MERLTTRDANCADPKVLYGVHVKNHDYISAANRLADYEDTGLTPEEFHAYWVFLEDLIGEQKASEALDRFRQLVKADRDGRLIIVDNTPRQVSPCDTCESGWGTATTTGYDSCFNHCEKLAEYRKQEG